MTESSKLAKNTLIYAMGDIIPKLLNLVTFPILTHHLTTGEYGIANYVYSIDSLLSILTFLGLKTFYLVHYYKVGDEVEQKKLLGNLTLIVLLFNVIITSSLLIIGDNIFRAIGGGVSFYPYIALGVGANFFSIFATLPSALYRVRENPMPLTIVNVVQGALILLSTIILIPKHPSATTVLSIKLVINFCFAVFFFVITCKNAIFRIDFQQLKYAFAFSLPIVPGDIAYYFSTMSDRILIEKYLTVTELGLYSTATTLAGMLNILSYGAYRAVEPHFFKTYGKAGFEIGFKKIRDVLLLVVISGALAMSLFSNAFLQIMSSEAYHVAYVLVPPLCLAITIRSMTMMYSTVMTAQSKTKLTGGMNVVCAILSVGLNILLLPLIGLTAAILANFLIALIGYLFCKKMSKMRIQSLYCITPVILYVVTIVIFVYLWHPSIYIDVVVKLLVLSVFVLISMKVMNIKKDLIYEIVPFAKKQKVRS